MRCMPCSTEMILMNVEAMRVPGYENHIFICSECRGVGHHLVFTRHGRECNIYAAPPAVPELTVHDEHVAPSGGLLGRLLAKIREDGWVSSVAE
jgi:hypothetical protein